MSPGKQGLINLDLLQREVKTKMRIEETLNPDPVVAQFNSLVLQSVQRYNYRPYSRQGVNNNCDWDRDRKYQRLSCYLGNTTYHVLYFMLTQSISKCTWITICPLSQRKRLKENSPRTQPRFSPTPLIWKSIAWLTRRILGCDWKALNRTQFEGMSFATNNATGQLKYPRRC